MRIGPRSLGIAVHAFMLFIVFNGVVIFEKGATRWIGIALFVAIGMIALRMRNRRNVSDTAPV